MVSGYAARLSHLCVALNLTTAEFAYRLGLPTGWSLPRKPRPDLLERVLDVFPAVRPGWLMLGDGDMFRSTPAASMTTSHTNYVGVNYGHCVQHITLQFTCSITHCPIASALVRQRAYDSDSYESVSRPQ
jgi:hypothetical protein